MFSVNLNQAFRNFAIYDCVSKASQSAIIEKNRVYNVNTFEMILINNGCIKDSVLKTNIFYGELELKDHIWTNCLYRFFDKPYTILIL